MSWFDCWHRRLYFDGVIGSFNLTFNNGSGINFSITPMVCTKCKKVEWKYMDGTLK